MRVLPVVRAVGSKASGTTGAVSVAAPSGLVVGDLDILIATTIAGGSISITTVGGGSWTAITNLPVDVASGEKLYGWYRISAAGDSNPSITPGSDHSCAARIAIQRNTFDPSDPLDIETTGSETTSDTSFSFAPGNSTSVDNSLCCVVCTSGADSNTGQGGTNTANSSLTSVTATPTVNYCTNSGGGGGFFFATGVKATAGTVGTWTNTMAGATPKAYISFAIKPYNPAKVDTFTEDFASALNTSVWDATAGAVATGGRLQITPDASYPSAATFAAFDLVGSSLLAELVQTAASADDTIFGFQVDANNEVTFDVLSGILRLHVKTAGVDNDDTSITYNNTTHRWLRIQESGGNLLWDTSTDGVSWTNRRSITAPSWVSASAGIVLVVAGGATATPVMLLDNINLPPASGTNWTATPSDAAGITDAQVFDRGLTVADAAGITDARAIDRGLTIADAAGVTDVATPSHGYVLAIADVAGITDADALGVGLSVADVMGVTDSMSSVGAFVRTVDDVAGITDSPSFVGVFARAIDDTMGITDVVDVVKVLAQAVDDAAGVTDAVVFDRGLAAADSAGITDAASSLGAFVRALDDPVAITDALSLAPALSLADAATITDATALVATFVRALVDTAGITDSAAPALGRNLTFPDAAGITDALARDLGLSLADVAAITDALLFDLALTITDAAAITDSVNTTSSGATSLSLSDSADIADLLTPLSTYTRSVDDVFGIADVTALALGRALAVSDAAAITDALASAADYVRSLADAAQITDTTTTLATLVRALADTAVITDTTASGLILVRSVDDSAAITDSLAFVAALVRAIDDSAALTDQLDTALAIVLALADEAGITDALLTEIILSTLGFRAMAGIVERAMAGARERSLTGRRQMSETGARERTSNGRLTWSSH